jgi:hypothetical protein
MAIDGFCFWVFLVNDLFTQLSYRSRPSLRLSFACFEEEHGRIDETRQIYQKIMESGMVAAHPELDYSKQG